MHIQKSSGTADAAQYISGAIIPKLQEGNNVLFLTTGGSGIAVVVEVAKILRESKVPLSTLTVIQTDERFGDVGHKDSNWKQIEDKGFSLPGATIIPTLSGLSLTETVNKYEASLRAQIQKATFCIGLFGMGADGHTAGILPGSSAVEEKAFAHGYEAPPFTRITMTAPAILMLDVAVLYAMGAEKGKAVLSLAEEKDIATQPAQVLKKLKEFVVFTDAL